MSGFTEIALLQYELAKLHTRVAELEERRCEVCGYAEHHREHTGCLRKQIEKLTAERDAALETIKQQHRIHVELVEEKEVAEAKADEEHKHSCKMAYQRDSANVESATLKSALKVARDALNDCEGALDECRDYPITYDTILEALAKINEVLK